MIMIRYGRETNNIRALRFSDLQFVRRQQSSNSNFLTNARIRIHALCLRKLSGVGLIRS